jgi:hypothetical protein
MLYGLCHIMTQIRAMVGFNMLPERAAACAFVLRPSLWQCLVKQAETRSSAMTL